VDKTPFARDLKASVEHEEFDRFTEPHYDGASVANLAPTIARLLGVSHNGRELKRELLVDDAEGSDHVILFVMDALGYNTLVLGVDMANKLNALFPEGVAKRGYITSVFPSTTVTALTSMFTGLLPSEHGMLGYNMFLKEIGSIVNMITLSPVNEEERGRIVALGFSHERILPHAKLTERLAQSGVGSRVLIRYALKGSGLSTLLYKGAEVIPYLGQSDMFLHLLRILREGKSGLTIVYWDNIDAAAHHYGPQSEETMAELSLFINSMEGFLKSAKRFRTKNVTLMLTSDHGQAQTRDRLSFRVEDLRWIKESLVMPPTGEGRCAYMYLRRGVRDFEQKFRKRLGKHFHLLDSSEAISMGLFGGRRLPRDYIGRIGDYIAVAKGAAKLVFAYNLIERSEPPFVRYGSHGGLTLHEMLVPFLNARLDKLLK
jgi:hypothetical protein